MLLKYGVVVNLPNTEKKCIIEFIMDNFESIKCWHNVVLYREGNEIIFLIDGFRFIVCKFDDAKSAEEAYRYLNSLDVTELWNIIYKWLEKFLELVETEVDELLKNIEIFAAVIRKLRSDLLFL